MNHEAIRELAARGKRDVYERLPVEALREKLQPYYYGKDLPSQIMFRNEKEYRKALIKELIRHEYGL